MTFFWCCWKIIANNITFQILTQRVNFWISLLINRIKAWEWVEQATHKNIMKLFLKENYTWNKRLTYPLHTFTPRIFPLGHYFYTMRKSCNNSGCGCLECVGFPFEIRSMSTMLLQNGSCKRDKRMNRLSTAFNWLVCLKGYPLLAREQNTSKLSIKDCKEAEHH